MQAWHAHPMCYVVEVWQGLHIHDIYAWPGRSDAVRKNLSYSCPPAPQLVLVLCAAFVGWLRAGRTSHLHVLCVPIVETSSVVFAPRPSFLSYGGGCALVGFLGHHYAQESRRSALISKSVMR